MLLQVLAVAASRSARDAGAGAGRLRKSVMSDGKAADGEAYELVDAVDPGGGAADTVDDCRHLSPVSSEWSPGGRERNNARGVI